MEKEKLKLYEPILDKRLFDNQTKKRNEQLMVEKSDNELTVELFLITPTVKLLTNPIFIDNKTQTKYIKNKYNKIEKEKKQEKEKEKLIDENKFNDIFGVCSNKDDTYYLFENKLK